jgi:predicted component of type VI protein secretion system
MFINVKALKMLVKEKEKQISKEAIMEIDKKLTEVVNEIITKHEGKRIKSIF